MASEDSVNLETAMIRWLSTFSSSDAFRRIRSAADAAADEDHALFKPSSLEELSDGIVAVDILAYLDPDRFSTTADSIRRPPSSSGSDASSLSGDDREANLKLLLEALRSFFASSHVFNDQPIAADFIDVKAAAQQHQRSALLNLFELVLVAAINSEHAEKCVENIMQLDENTQHQLMFIINDVKERLSNGTRHGAPAGVDSPSLAARLGAPHTPSSPRGMALLPPRAPGSGPHAHSLHLRSPSGGGLHSDEVVMALRADNAALQTKVRCCIQCDLCSVHRRLHWLLVLWVVYWVLSAVHVVWNGCTVISLPHSPS